MRLIFGAEKGCVIASVAMLTDLTYGEVKEELMPHADYPFSSPWDSYPKVPSTDEVCDWLWKKFGRSLTPFNRDPGCSPDRECPPVPVWENGEKKWREQLKYGSGLLEGTSSRMGHMCAWDGVKVFDPKGYIYAWEDSSEYKFNATRFWLWQNL